MTKQGKGTGKRKDKGTVLSHSGHFRLGECVSPGLKLRTFQETKFPQRLATLFCAFLLKMRDWEACTILHVVTWLIPICQWDVVPLRSIFQDKDRPNKLWNSWGGMYCWHQTNRQWQPARQFWFINNMFRPLFEPKMFPTVWHARIFEWTKVGTTRVAAAFAPHAGCPVQV